MGDYKKLAVKYLKANRARSIITIIGVAITVMVLYGGLNFAYSYLLNAREETRQEKDYEFVLMTESKAQAEQIASDSQIEKAYIGKYEYTDWQVDEQTGSSTPVKTLYRNAVYATGDNPFHMEKNMDDIMDRYGVKAELNVDLAVLYFQEGTTDGSMLMVVVWLILLIAYIFAIFAVGIIRNTVQMFMMEQIKDYGILRCIGSTKGQLKKIIYLMGAMLECAGIVIGVIVGGFITLLVGAFAGVSAGYHLIAAVPVLICYLGDLYFVMRDNSKIIVKMTPISAVRGQFRIKTGRIRTRGKGLMGRLFGIEGEYARKSVLRNRGRYVKTIASLSVSIAALVAVVSVSGALDKAVEFLDGEYGTYQVQVYETPSQLQDIDSVEAGLPDAESLQRIADNRYTLAARKVYAANVYVADIDELYSKYNDAYINTTMYGNMLESYKKMYENDKSLAMGRMRLSGITLHGMDASGMKDLSQYLVDGTVDVSDHGIVVVTGGSSAWSDDDEDSLTYQTLEHIQVNDYKVGDTIAIVNTDKLFTETQKAIEQAGIAKTGGDRADDTIADPDAEKRISIANEVYDRLVAEGDYTTYTVEGILDLGAMLTGESGIQVYTSVDNYLAETGYTESQISGMEYQIDSTRITNRSIDDMVSYLYTDTGAFDFYMYVENLRTFQSFKEFNRVILMIAALVFALGAVNIINATAGNLHMRRKEFAQLRVIGMSRKRLIKTVLLEGIMTAFWSNILGILIGTGVYYGEYYFIRLMFQMRFAPSVTAIVVGVVLSMILVFGSILIPLRRLPQSMAEDLTLEE